MTIILRHAKKGLCKTCFRWWWLQSWKNLEGSNGSAKRVLKGGRNENESSGFRRGSISGIGGINDDGTSSLMASIQTQVISYFY
jgi:hypothetical protein